MLAKVKLVLVKSIKQLYWRHGQIWELPFSFLQRLFTRRLDLVFFSPTKALKVACHKPTSQSTRVTLKLASREVRLPSGMSGLSIHRNAISYPLVNVPRPSDLTDHAFFDFYFGGLMDSNTQTLIHEANHYRDSTYIQSLPIAHTEKYSLDYCMEIQQPCLYGGILFNHFGHFVSESLSRLYAYSMVREYDPFILFYSSWGMISYLEKDNFANQIFTGFGIPVERIIFLDKVAKIREIVIPVQRYGFGFIHRADEVFIEFARKFRYKRKFPIGFEEGDNIYVSRSRLRKSGRQIGDQYFEKYLSKEGYKIFFPEQHTLAEQLTVYAGARRVIFAEGSALLSGILLPDLKAEVAVVTRRRDPSACIRMTTDCFQGYGKHILWIDAVLGQYQFGLNTANALADIDWREVSLQLYKHGFVSQPLSAMTDEEHLSLVNAELREYLREIHENPKFIDYMMRLKENYPRWTGSSQQVDPRNGLPVWPPEDLQ